MEGTCKPSPKQQNEPSLGQEDRVLERSILCAQLWQQENRGLDRQNHKGWGQISGTAGEPGRDHIHSFNNYSFEFLLSSWSLVVKILFWALASVAQWIESQPTNWKVTSSTPSQGTCMGCRPGPQLVTCNRQPIDVFLTHWCFFSSLSPSLTLSKNK